MSRTTKRNKSSKARTPKRRQRGGVKKIKNTGKPAHIVLVFLEMLNVIKLYHWKTRSYSQHKATDELYERLNKNIDEFVEVLLGKDESRIKLMEKRIDLADSENLKDFKARIYEYRQFLTDFNIHFDGKKDSDLLSIRDQILADINQFLYLLTFDK
jgi:DNA-binding ferritin-like protein